MQRAFWMIIALGLMLTACAPASTTVTSTAPPAATTATTDATTAPATPEQEPTVPLPNGPLAPELTNETWLNTQPLTPADLRGKIVLIDFWTFG